MAQKDRLTHEEVNDAVRELLSPSKTVRPVKRQQLTRPVNKQGAKQSLLNRASKRPGQV